MIDKDDLVSLTWEQKKKYKSAIGKGYFDNFQDDPRTWKHSLVGSIIWKHPQRSKTVDRLAAIAGHEPRWEDMTDENLRDFVEEVQEEIAASSARTICAELKAILHINKRKIPSEDYLDILTLKNEVSQAIYLTRDEMRKIAGYVPATELEEFVKRNFMVEFLTGARRCDAERLNISHCDIETGTLSYVPQKTPGIVVTVPVDERFNLRDFLAYDKQRECCTATFNYVIRNICRKCDIDSVCTIQRRGASVTAPKWQLVSSHTARRSFATNLYLSGVSLEDIAILMGHGKNIETTKRYICAERKLSSSVIAYFRPPMEEVMCYKEEEEEDDEPIFGRKVEITPRVITYEDVDI